MSCKTCRNIPIISQKSLRLTALFLISPLFFFGQTLTGLWTGALSNDSSTVRKDQSFEIALTEYRGKVYGYSRSEFIVDDTLYYVVKRVKGIIEGDICEVTDDEIISYNFRGKLDKGIKVTSTFRRNQNDSTWYLDGTWKTNATKKYYAVTGKVNLEEEKDLTASKIFPHLEELKLADDIAFYKDRKEGPPIVKLVNPEKIKTEYSTKVTPLPANTDVAFLPAKPNLERAETIAPVVGITKPTEELPKTDTKSVAINSVDIVPSAPDKIIAENKVPDEEVAPMQKPMSDLPKTDIKNIATSSVDIAPVVSTKALAGNKVPVRINPVATSTGDIVSVTNKEQQKQVSAPSVVNKNSITTTSTVVNNPASSIATTKQVTETKKPGLASVNTVKPNAIVTNNPVPETKEVKTEPVAPVSVVPETKKPPVDIIARSASVAGRKSEFSQIVSFKSDSLELSLYDNGEIDDDTVSVFMNGEVILSKQGLKGSAIKKTIYITPGNEDFTLVLFAENLGKYPPNTGLLVVHDGEDVYNLRFSSDYQKSSGIVFRRKKD